MIGTLYLDGGLLRSVQQRDDMLMPPKILPFNGDREVHVLTSRISVRSEDGANCVRAQWSPKIKQMSRSDLAGRQNDCSFASEHCLNAKSHAAILGEYARRRWSKPCCPVDVPQERGVSCYHRVGVVCWTGFGIPQYFGLKWYHF